MEPAGSGVGLPTLHPPGGPGFAPGMGGHGFAPPGYPAVEGAQGRRSRAADVETLKRRPGAPLPWQRVVLIVGFVVLAIVIAFAIARAVRGSERAPPASPAHAVGMAPRSAPVPASPPSRSTAAATAAPAAATAAPTGAAATEPDRPAAQAATPTPPKAALAADPGDGGGGADEAAPEDDGEAVAGGTPVVGSGPCRFTVATTPAGSIVRFDDQPMGPSPITIESSCDKHKLDVSHVRYQSVTRWVALTADKPEEIDIALPRPIHAVTVTSFPPGAELSIDGHRAGTTPTVVQMMGFATVHLTFTRPGFQTVTRKIYSKLTQDRVFVKLMK
jgi:hypothetical protein